MKHEPVAGRRRFRAFLIWCWQDLRDDWNRLEAAKVMCGILIFPICLGIVYEIGKAIGLSHQ